MLVCSPACPDAGAPTSAWPPAAECVPPICGVEPPVIPLPTHSRVFAPHGLGVETGPDLSAQIMFPMKKNCANAKMKAPTEAIWLRGMKLASE